MQSVNPQYFEEERPRFTWVRGQRCRVVMEPPLREPNAFVPITDLPPPLPTAVYGDDLLRRKIFEEEHPVLVCEGTGATYKPLTDTPDAYLRFAAVTLLPKSDKEGEEAVVWFVQHYGLPRSPEPFRARGSAGLPLDMFLDDRAALGFTVRRLSATSRAEHRGEFKALRALFRDNPPEEPLDGLGSDGTLLFYAKHYLAVMLNKHLVGVRLAPIVDIMGLVNEIKTRQGRRSTNPPPVRILPQYTCDSLLTAMWLQLYFAATERRIINVRCRGCGRPFEAKDSRQEYCDADCRHATNQRNYYQRQKEKGAP